MNTAAQGNSKNVSDALGLANRWLWATWGGPELLEEQLAFSASESSHLLQSFVFFQA